MRVSVLLPLNFCIAYAVNGDPAGREATSTRGNSVSSRTLVVNGHGISSDDFRSQVLAELSTASPAISRKLDKLYLGIDSGNYRAELLGPSPPTTVPLVDGIDSQEAAAPRPPKPAAPPPLQPPPPPASSPQTQGVPSPAAPFRSVRAVRKRDYSILTPLMWDNFIDAVALKSIGSTEKMQLLSTKTTQNGVLDNNTACAPMTIIFARGTLESGNVGKLAGPPFFAAVAAAMGNANHLAVQGVDYVASVPGFLLGGDAGGSTTMANLIEQTLIKCPETKLCVSGYSQGAQLVHNAALQLSAVTLTKLSSIVLFGDPENGTALNSGSNKLSAAALSRSDRNVMRNGNVLTICHIGDTICKGLQFISDQHLTYARDAGQAAAFVVSRSGLGMGVSMTMPAASMPAMGMSIG